MLLLLLQITEQLKFPTLWMRFPTKKVVNLFFGRKSHPEGRKSFCSAFVVFLRETFLFVESTPPLLTTVSQFYLAPPRTSSSRPTSRGRVSCCIPTRSFSARLPSSSPDDRRARRSNRHGGTIGSATCIARLSRYRPSGPCVRSYPGTGDS